MYDNKTLIPAATAVLMACAPAALAGNGVIAGFSARAKDALVSFDYSMRLKGEVPLTGSGSVVFKGDAYRLTGKGMELVSDGVTRWTADAAAKELYIEDAADAGQMLLASPALLLRDLGSAFVSSEERTVSFGGKKATAVTLTPIRDDSGIQTMTVYFISGDPAGAEVTTDDGSVTVITITKLALSQGEGPSFVYDASALGSDWEITDLR